MLCHTFEFYGFFINNWYFNWGSLLTLQLIIDSQKRIHFIYLFSSCVLALWVYFRRNTKGSFFKFIFSKKIWFSKSAFIDYSFVFFNAFVKVVVWAPIFTFGLLLAQYTEKLLVVFFDQLFIFAKWNWKYNYIYCYDFLN